MSGAPLLASELVARYHLESVAVGAGSGSRSCPAPIARRNGARVAEDWLHIVGSDLQQAAQIPVEQADDAQHHHPANWPLGNTEKMWDNSGRKKPHKTLKIRAGKMAVTVEILPR
jgi:hypothetical protein